MSDRRFISAVAADQSPADAASVTTPRGANVTKAAVVMSSLGLAAAAWVIVARQMAGMDMGVATKLGSFASFTGLWVTMMVAMMLPGAVPAAVRHVRAAGSALTAPRFVASYLFVWAMVGVLVYALYRPHGSVAAATVVIAAGIYELTPLKRHFRARCYANAQTGLEYAARCVGSSIGLMVMLVALGFMNVGWMIAVTAIAVTQKLLPAKAAVDVPIALAIVGFGIFIMFAPASVPGLVPPM